MLGKPNVYKSAKASNMRAELLREFTNELSQPLPPQNPPPATKTKLQQATLRAGVTNQRRAWVCRGAVEKEISTKQK